MFFGGLFLAFAVARFLYAENFNQAAKHLDLVAGSINTGILFTSSFTTALAVSTLKRDWRLSTIGLLLLSIALGSLFLVIKGYEYHEKWVEGLVPGAGFTSSEPPHNQLFFIFYFTLTRTTWDTSSGSTGCNVRHWLAHPQWARYQGTIHAIGGQRVVLAFR